MDPDRDRGDDDNFSGLSGRILLVASFSLIFVGAMVALLHFYVRYLALRQARRRRDFLNSLAAGQVAPVDLIAVRTSTFPVYRDPQQPAALLPGLDVSVIASLPAFVWTDGDGGEPIECSVCLSLVAGGARVRMLPNCKHVFHVECIDKWLASHATCPVCRAEAVPGRVWWEEKAAVEARVQPSAPPRDVVRQ